ncbi:MAG: hypothetical protein JXB88_18770 [Spirochaetales bacterium]|nr:hypothetical protein [Spirochaetales bacterium]
MKKYFAITRNTLIDAIVFRADFFFRTLGNLIYIFVVFYLWKAIYADSPGELNGLTFLQAFTYLAVSGSIFILVETWVDWGLSLSITRGHIVMNLYLPLDLHLMIQFNAFGTFLFRLVSTGLPSILFIVLVFNAPVAIGINLIFFIVSLFFSFLMSVNIDFAVGVSAFSFESILGLKFMKDCIILFLSGAIVPIPFFPKPIQAILLALPFQGMYHTPVNILLGRLSVEDSLLMLCIQMGWIAFFIIIGRLFYRKILKKLTISGG